MTNVLKKVEKANILMIKKENTVVSGVNEDGFWKGLSEESMRNAWDKKDNIWDKINAKGKTRK